MTPALLLLTALLAPSPESAAMAEDPYFTDVTDLWGIDFVHRSGRGGQFYFPEMAGPGGALFDADGDGDLDLYLVQGGALGPQVDPTSRPGDRLYRNDLGRSGPRFTDITEASGLRAQGYGMGVAVGDVDGDGDLDLYVLNAGPNQLWLSNGDGPRYVDASETSGTAGDAWSSSAVFFDADRDGALDLYVVDYVDFRLDNNIVCYAPSSRRDYCGPQAFRPVGDHLYRHRANKKTPTFEDVTTRLLTAYKPGSGLGVSLLDANGDGGLDLYVANDGEPNQLWLRQPDGTFLDEALFSGVAINRAGQPEASMGLAVGDPDADGDDDLFVSHLTAETNTFYVNIGDALFEDRSVESGLGAPSLPMTGFGTAWLDIDGDAWLDLVVVNGAVRIQEALAATGDDYPLDQPNQLFRNRGAASKGLAFEEVTARGGTAFTEPSVSRGLIAGDIDNDGDTDLVIVDNDGPPRVLRNDLDPRRFIGLRLLDGQRDTTFARVGLHLTDGRTVWRRAARDGSYASSSDPRITVALAGTLGVRSIEVRWPGGDSETFAPPPLGRYTELRRGNGLRETP